MPRWAPRLAARRTHHTVVTFPLEWEISRTSPGMTTRTQPSLPRVVKPTNRETYQRVTTCACKIEPRRRGHKDARRRCPDWTGKVATRLTCVERGSSGRTIILMGAETDVPDRRAGG